MPDKRFGFPKRERLRGQKRISLLFKSENRGFVYPFRFVYSTDSEAGTGISTLIVIPKRYHKKAHDRNLLKRRTREALRQNERYVSEKPEKRFDLALIYSVGDTADYKTIENAIGKIIGRIMDGM